MKRAIKAFGILVGTLACMATIAYVLILHPLIAAVILGAFMLGALAMLAWEVAGEW